MDASTIINKSIFNSTVLNAGGRLNPEQADRFIQQIIDEPTIMKEARTVKMIGDSRKIEKIGFGQRILYPGVEGKELDESNFTSPATSMIQLNAKEVIAVVRITDDTIENNIELGNLNNTVMNMIGQRVALDIEELVLNGDTKNGADDYLKLIDGLRVQATKHIVDAAGKPLEKDFMKNAKKALPKKYLRNARDWRYYCSYNQETEWQDLVATRNTVAGDTHLLEAPMLTAYGIPVKGIAMLQPYKDTETDVSDMLLTNPQNIVVGISRDIRIETERLPKARATDIVVTMKVDAKFEEEDAVVKVTKIKE